ncbi:MAG: hypothetical protein FJ245_06925 [Nitrospira sp.]|nr:hypothetical protein [Nitrospira sp.]
MTTITGDVAIQSLHDQISSLVAQRWAKSFQCKVTISPGSETAEPDVFGWQFSPTGNRVEWIAEVETEDSLTRLDRYKRWQTLADKSVPFYLVVPKGYRSKVRQLAVMAGVDLNGIYEYAFLNDTFQLA